MIYAVTTKEIKTNRRKRRPYLRFLSSKGCYAERCFLKYMWLNPRNKNGQRGESNTTGGATSWKNIIASKVQLKHVSFDTVHGLFVYKQVRIRSALSCSFLITVYTDIG